MSVLFDGWPGIGRVVVVGVCAYIGLVALLRVSGKRTLSKLNAFDLIVTVALGSTLATVLLSSTVALAEGVTAFVVLVALQFVVTWTSVRLPWVRRAVRSEATLILYQGELLEDALRRQRVTEEEVKQVLREHGRSTTDGVGAVVLETDGTFTVLDRPPADDPRNGTRARPWSESAP